MMKNYEVAIIGSGAAGLASALLFAKRGKKVAVLEQASKIAPLLAGFDRNNVHFETGFHYSGALGKNEAGGFLFKELGIELDVSLCNQDNYYEVFMTDKNKIFKIPFGYELLKERLEEYFPKEKEGIEKFLNLTKKTVDAVPFLNVHKKVFKKSEDFFYFSNNIKTLKDVLDDCFSCDEIKSVLASFSMLYGVASLRVYFDFHCCCCANAYESVWKINGGASALVNAMKKALDKNSVDIFVNKKVVKIEKLNEGKKLSFQDGSSLLCDTCVSCIHPKEFLKIAPEGVYKKIRAGRINNLEESIGFFMLYGILKKDLGYKNSNRIFLTSDSYKSDNKNLISTHFSDTNPQTVSIFLTVDSAQEFWDIDELQYREKKERLSQYVKHYLSQNAPELLEQIDFVEISTPKTMKKYVNYYGSYGIMHCIDSVNMGYLTKIPKLFTAGQAFASPGILGAVISAFLLDKIIDCS